MKNVAGSIKMSLLKRQEALDRFKAKKAAFLIAREQITSDIEEAREIWMKTLEQLPVQEFETNKIKDYREQNNGNTHQTKGIRKSINPSTYHRINLSKH